MGEFSAEWLALREPADHAARSEPITQAIAGVLARRDRRKVVDLGAGTGSNMRYLAARLPAVQQWLLVDHDASLLARAAQTEARAAATIETRQVDLSTIVGSAPAWFRGAGLVTASALLDLVSNGWVGALAEHCRETGAAALFVLSYDGRIDCQPADSDDGAIRDLVNQHQRTDKGFGAALGPDATDCAEDRFAALGYQVQRDRSDWLLDAASSELQRQLIEGWAAAATAIAPHRSSFVGAWRTRRLDHVGVGRSRIRVGHEDFAAWLP